MFLLGSYIVFRRIFPLADLDKRFSDVTVGEFLLIVFEVLVALVASGYLIIKGLRCPHLQDRDRLWCERWSGLAFGVAAILMASVSVVLLERKGIDLGLARPIAHGILRLLL
jgi:hypothetical protein